MQIQSAHEVDIQVMVPQIITINAARVEEDDILIIPGAKHLVAVTPVRVEQFIISVRDAVLRRPDLMPQQHLTIGMLVALLGIQLRGLLIVAQEVRTNGMVIITFYVRSVAI